MAEKSDSSPVAGKDSVENPFQSPDAGKSEHDAGQTDGFVNPWTAIWFRPGSVMRQETARNRSMLAIQIAILGGVANSLFQSWYSLAPDIETRFISLVVLIFFGAFYGLMSLYLLGWFSAFIGRLNGGVGQMKDCRIAIAWSHVPAIWIMLPMLVMALYAAFVGPEILVWIESENQDYLDHPPWFQLAVLLVRFVQIWQLLLMSQCIGEIHEISTINGFITMLMSSALFYLLMFGCLAGLLALLAAL